MELNTEYILFHKNNILILNIRGNEFNQSQKEQK